MAYRFSQGSSRGRQYFKNYKAAQMRKKIQGMIEPHGISPFRIISFCKNNFKHFGELHSYKKNNPGIQQMSLSGDIFLG